MKRERVLLGALPPQIGPRSARILVGIGDDAAVLARPKGKIVVTDDAQIEGTHFTRELLTFEDVGYRATMAAASDLAAMGAEPLAALAAVSLPGEEGDDAILEAIFAGQKAAADEIGAAIVGGNLSHAPIVSITTTWVGETMLPVLRSGARVGDGVWVAGPLGKSAAGLRVLQAGLPLGGAVERCANAWRRPLSRIREARQAASKATAAIDVSDGLVSDVRHICKASRVRIVLDAAKILAVAGDDVEAVAKRLDLDPLDLALAGGEDYALVVTSPDDLAPHGFQRIGAVGMGEPDVVVMRGGARVSTREGYDHFAR